MRRGWLTLLLLIAPPLGAQSGGLQYGVVVVPESVTVGDPFRVVLRIRAPRGSVIEFPATPDSSDVVGPLAALVVAAARDSTQADQSATYQLAAWDVGTVPIRFADILVRDGERVRRLSVGRDLSVVVTTVLPADSALRVAKPPRAVFAPEIPWWWWGLVAVAVALIAALCWWWWRQRGAPQSTATVDPHAAALREFQRLDALGLVSAGELSQHAAIAAEIVRRYLASVCPLAHVALTTSEVAATLRGDGRVPLSTLQRLLHEVDLVKFAQERLSAERAQRIATDGRALVDRMHELSAASTEQSVAA